jgi:hypothetical protein
VVVFFKWYYLLKSSIVKPYTLTLALYPQGRRGLRIAPLLADGTKWKVRECVLTYELLAKNA